MTRPAALDEMVDGKGGLRPHWRSLIGAFSALGEGGLRERAMRLDRAFEEEGVLSSTAGARFRDEVLGVGGSRPAAESFRAFRGRDPSIDALLRHNGMIAA